MASADAESKTKELREAAQKLLAADYFGALGVSRTASADEVKRAFIETAKTWHPDRVPQGLDELKPLFGKVFARLELARSTVGDASRRARYIEELAKPHGATAGDHSLAEATVEFRKAEAMLKKNDTVKALEHLTRAVHLAPAKAEYRALLIWLKAKPDATLERLRELVADLDKVLKEDATCEMGFYYRGMLKKRLDMPKPAFADFTRAADLNPKNLEAMREIRIFNMRKEHSEPGGAQGKKDAADDDGPLGFFKKLFKR